MMACDGKKCNSCKSNEKGKRREKGNFINKWIPRIALIILFIAVILTYFKHGTDYSIELEQVLPEAETFHEIASNPLTFEGLKNDEKIGYAVVDQANAYGGPLTMVVGISLDGTVIGTAIADHNDTPTFIQIIHNKDYMKQFLNKKVDEPFSIEEDIQHVSGATFSSDGIAEAIAKGSHAVAEEQFGMTINKEDTKIQFGMKEIALLLILTLVIVGIKFRIKSMRWITMIGSLILLGFVFGSLVSLGNIASIFMGHFPPLKENIFWYLFFIGIPLLILILGKNIYCYWICPFGTIQELAAKIGGGKFRSKNKWINQHARKIKYILAYVALMIALITGSAGIASYEPFSTLFSMQGVGIQWFILPVVLFTSFFIFRFWCNFFCPISVANELILKLRRVVKRGGKSWKRRNDQKEKSSL